MQFMPRMTAKQRREVEEFKRQLELETGKTTAELNAELIAELTGKTGVPVHIVGDDHPVPRFVREAQAKLNGTTLPEDDTPAQSPEDLLRDWLGL
jgi:hypothetical protein